MGREYRLLDVFTDRPLGGNQLAVFPQAEGLSAATMQAIARELNLSETVFVLNSGPEADYRLRIFTPAMELPFAGHPTIGAAIALAEMSAAGSRPTSLILAEAAGPVPVDLREQDGRLFATLTSPLLPAPVTHDLDASAIARTVGLPPEHLGPIAPTAYSAGVPFLFIPVVSRDALRSVAIDLGAYRAHIAASAAPHLVVLTMDDWSAARDVRLRMFAPLMGIAEDPATGAAAAALAGLLAEHQRPTDGWHPWTLHQGHEMGRPSTLYLEAHVSAGRLTAVRVGGTAVTVGRGVLEVE